MSRGPAGRNERAPNRIRSIAQIGDAFNRNLQELFHRAGWTVASYPFAFLGIAIAISFVTAGVPYLKFAQRLQEGFISSDSPSRREQAVKTEFDGQASLDVQRFVALIRRKDNGSLLSKDQFDRIFEVHKFLSEEISVTIDDARYFHKDVCGEHCDANGLLQAFQAALNGVYDDDDVLLDHPQSRLHTYSFLVAHHLFGIERKKPLTKPEDHSGDIIIKRDLPKLEVEKFSANPLNSNKSFLSSINLVALYYQAPLSDKNLTNILTNWETTVFEWSQEQADFPEFRIDVMGDKILGQEMVRGGLKLIPYLLCGLAFTVLFVCFSVAINSFYMGSCDFGRVIIVIGIVISPLLAVFSTFGVMGFAKIEIYPIQMVIPFLILAIGVDDAFLMLHAWNRLLPEMAHLKTKGRRESIPIIFAKVLEESGPSITLTSLTNALAFGIGTTVDTPAIRLFCMAAMIAMIMDFIFEIILFGSLLAISGRFYRPRGTSTSSPSKTLSKFLSNYSRWLTKNSTRAVVLTLTVVFLGVSIYGTMRIKTRINSQKIIPYDSKLLDTDKCFRDFFWKEYEPLQIFVNNPPDIEAPDGMESLMAMVREFESLPRAMGPQSTMLFLNDYRTVFSEVYDFYKLLGGNFRMSYSELPFFLLETKAGLLWNRTVKWHKDENGKVIVDGFTFYTGFHNATTWMQRSENMLHWRAVADRWKRFNVTTFSENSPVFEGIFGLRWTTIQTAGYTLFSMLFVCVLFVPSFAGVLTAALAITSISLGVFGFLSWWGLDLDPVTMSAIVMSIGFSVDYTAHVSYHYQRAQSVLPNRSLPSDYVYYTVSAVGWPMVEAALSTVVCFLPVAVHPDYTPTVFVRTIVLVVGWGVLHGLLILPIILSLIPRRFFVSESPPTPCHQTVPMIIETKDCQECPDSNTIDDVSSSDSSNTTAATLLTSEITELHSRESSKSNMTV